MPEYGLDTAAVEESGAKICIALQSRAQRPETGLENATHSFHGNAQCPGCSQVKAPAMRSVDDVHADVDAARDHALSKEDGGVSFGVECTVG